MMYCIDDMENEMMIKCMDELHYYTKREWPMKKKKKKKKKQLINNSIESKFSIKTIFGMFGGVVTVYPIVNFIYNVFYQSECEKFYGVPSKYFHSSINNILIYLGGILILILLGASTIFLKKYDEKNNVKVKGVTLYVSVLAISVGLIFGLLNVYNLIEIMKQTHKTNDFFRSINIFLNNNAVLTIIVVIALSVIAWLGITLNDIINSIKSIRIKTTINIICVFSIVLSILLMTYGTIFKLSISIEDKTKYEFVILDKDDYVILSEYNDKFLIVKYEIDNNGQYIFDTSKYWFCEKNQGSYSYISLKYRPKVNFDKEKDNDIE